MWALYPHFHSINYQYDQPHRHRTVTARTLYILILDYRITATPTFIHLYIMYMLGGPNPVVVLPGTTGLGQPPINNIWEVGLKLYTL